MDINTLHGIQVLTVFFGLFLLLVLPAIIALLRGNQFWWVFGLALIFCGPFVFIVWPACLYLACKRPTILQELFDAARSAIR